MRWWLVPWVAAEVAWPAVVGPSTAGASAASWAAMAAGRPTVVVAG